MLYAQVAGPDYTIVSNWWDATPAQIRAIEKEIKTPLALATLCGIDPSEYNATKGFAKVVPAAAAAGWKLVRWGWTTHGDYKVLLFAKRFAQKPLKSWKVPDPDDDYYADDQCYGALDCSCEMYFERSELNGFSPPTASENQPNGPVLGVYAGPHLSTKERLLAKRHGWHSILRSSLLAWGYAPAMLPRKEKLQYGVAR
jgi:hypothetical protein